jgi:septal ring factor EnvC (AmiA/AmiB activator)
MSEQVNTRERVRERVCVWVCLLLTVLLVFFLSLLLCALPLSHGMFLVFFSWQDCHSEIDRLDDEITAYTSGLQRTQRSLLSEQLAKQQHRIALVTQQLAEETNAARLHKRELSEVHTQLGVIRSQLEDAAENRSRIDLVSCKEANSWRK